MLNFTFSTVNKRMFTRLVHNGKYTNITFVDDAHFPHMTGRNFVGYMSFRVC